MGERGVRRGATAVGQGRAWASLAPTGEET